MPTVLINAWENIWEMEGNNTLGKRNYHTDFELYDRRANNHEAVVIDLFIGVN